MALTATIILYLNFIFFFFGQLFRINFNNFSFPVIDISIFLLFLINIIIHIKNKTLQVKNKYFFIFLIFTWVSYFINLIHLHTSLVPLLYLLRLSFLISFFIFPIYLSNSKHKYFFHLAIFSNIIFGLIQYIFWPNFTYFNSLNWDPHLYRLISTYFDPTFTALIYLIFLIYIFLKTKFKKYYWLLIITYLAMVLTYSRSSYLSFLVAFGFIAYKLKNIKIFIISLFIILITIFALPRLEGEGTKLERTSSIKAKILNYQEAITVFKKSPLFGFGYNNLAYIRQINNPQSHSNNGFDSSLMTILTTTGIIGLIFFLIGVKTYFLKSDLFHQTVIITILCHSLFANSLLYPFILLLLFLI